jgi:hypothetical protein
MSELGPQIGQDKVMLNADGWPFAMFRLFYRKDAEDTEKDSPHVVLFEAWQIFGWDDADTSTGFLFGDGCLPLDGSEVATEDNRLLSGFIKFDGCMQGHWDYEQLGFHFDNRSDIDELHALLMSIREKCMEIMGERDE